MRKVLVVDDEEAILRLLTAVLEMHDFAVTTASSAGEAIGLLGQDQYDLVLTDLRMESPLAGFDVVQTANRIEPRPVIVILTAFPVAPADWKKAGADALYVKGSNILSLPKQLQALLKQRGSARADCQATVIND